MTNNTFLFTPFDKVVTENNGIDGVGIGLAISKQLTQLMNGKIGLQSTPNKGSTFWVELNSITGGKNSN